MRARRRSVLVTLAASAAATTALVLATGGTAVGATGVTGAQVAAAAGASSGPSNVWRARSGLPTGAAQRLQAAIDAQIAAYGGTQISPYEVAYNGGDPIMVFADPTTGEFPTGHAYRVEPLTTSYRYGYPYTSTNGWACFYQNIDYNHHSCGGGPCGDGGRMLQFESCGNQSLATYGFSDQTSSWVNNTNSYVTVYDNGGSLLWSEASGYASAYVGSGDNDRANSFWLIC